MGILIINGVGGGGVDRFKEGSAAVAYTVLLYFVYKYHIA